MSQLKFLECIDNQILLSMVTGCLCFASMRAPPLYLMFTYNPCYITLGHPVLYPFPDKKMCSFPPSVVVVVFLLLSFQLAKSNITGVENTTTVPAIVTSVVGISILVPCTNFWIFGRLAPRHSLWNCKTCLHCRRYRKQTTRSRSPIFFLIYGYTTRIIYSF